MTYFGPAANKRFITLDWRLLSDPDVRLPSGNGANWALAAYLFDVRERQLFRLTCLKAVSPQPAQKRSLVATTEEWLLMGR
jgi:hypothetical protein